LRKKIKENKKWTITTPPTLSKLQTYVKYVWNSQLRVIAGSNTQNAIMGSARLRIW
jgi:hypothetical protein